MLAAIAVILFVLSVFDVALGSVDLIALGLAFVAAHLAFGARVEAFGMGRRG